ncbi:MAG: hypothetical protein ACLPKE_31100 [Streptosporangiaceae bacterium]
MSTGTSSEQATAAERSAPAAAGPLAGDPTALGRPCFIAGSVSFGLAQAGVVPAAAAGSPRRAWSRPPPRARRSQSDIFPGDAAASGWSDRFDRTSLRANLGTSKKSMAAHLELSRNSSVAAC